MKPIKGVLVSSIVAASLLGSTSAWAAGLSGDALRTADGRIMADVTTQAGIGDFEDKDGAAASAAFRSPASVAVLPDGSVLVADTRNHNLRKISASSVSTYAGPELPVLVNDLGFPVGGQADGKAGEAFFNEPSGLAVDAQGAVYVADAGNNTIRKVAKDGTVTTLAGSGEVGAKDGKGAEAQFNYPTDVAVAADGTVYVADSLNHAIRKIAADGTVSTLNAASTRAIQVRPGEAAFAGDYADGSLAQAKFNEPSGLAIDAKGNLYVSDTGNQRIRYIDLAAGTVTTVAGSGKASDSSLYEQDELYAAGDYADGAASAAMFDFPKGIALTAEGGLVIADSLNHAIRYLLDSKVTTLAGTVKTGEADGVESAAQFYSPSDVAVAADGSLIIADAYNNKIRKLTPYQLPAGLPAQGVKVVHNHDAITFDAQPEVIDGRTMVPVRAIGEAFGYEVKYEEKNGVKAVQLVKGDVTVELYIGKTGVARLEAGKAAVNTDTDAAPYIKQDRTYVPVRFFAEQIGLDVQWDQATTTAILREKAFTH
ncbi:copper amine oxidase [Paenibacillus athensensis]|uniref:Copper amine oxidase n=1 Tax=Paenibacillus athensensis TaxID=1967502 RepID=A0A4Y8Q9V3_9BACL|nr:stalk domain-containing protein [Paenibacillus athensensis]MCD1259089.1 copper amine oxidase [Paenibacillus athensensis]